MKQIAFFLIMATLFSCTSPKRIFKTETQQFAANCIPAHSTIGEDAIKMLPEPVQRYYHFCGFMGQTVSDRAEIIWKESFISMKPGQKWMKLKTLQQNFINEPRRLAYMKAHIMGIIPFEGRDRYSDGNGHMLGTIARLVKIFNEKDPEIAQGAAIVVLAECLLFPGMALQEYIVWEAVDDSTAKARFIHKNINVGGVFHFNEKGEYIRFTSDERPYAKPGGGFELIPYTVLISDYINQDSIKIATHVRAIWNLPDGDYEYWKGTVSEIKFFNNNGQ